MCEAELKRLAIENPGALPHPFREMVAMDGFEALVYLSDSAGGTALYVPQRQTMFRELVGMAARREYNGANLRKLAKKYGYSESGMRYLLKD